MRCSPKIKNGAREDIKLTRSSPVIWVYLTGWANPDGAANFRNDVYGLDAAADASARRRRAARTLPLPCPRPRNDRFAAAAEPRRSLRRARRRQRARRADGQSRRAFSSPRPKLGRRRWASRQWISCLCAFQGRRRASGATATPSCSFSTSRRRSPPATGRASSVAAPMRKRSAAPSPPAADEARRKWTPFSTASGSKISPSAMATAARRTARRRDDRAERTAVRRARRRVAAMELLRLWRAAAAARAGIARVLTPPAIVPRFAPAIVRAGRRAWTRRRRRGRNCARSNAVRTVVQSSWRPRGLNRRRLSFLVKRDGVTSAAGSREARRFVMKQGHWS